MDNLNFEFAPTGGGDITGINDPVTTTFKGNLSWSLARESIQNIIDAHDPKSLSPAEAYFRLTDLMASDFPKLNQLKEKLDACRQHYRTNPDAVKFYSAAISKIELNVPIKMLKISDYNTVGLTGGNDDDTGNYFSLMKAVGSTSKSETEGGSFGLGKGAYYAASSFRTIFVSSIYDKDKYVFQGKSRLASFRENDQWMQGNGSFGLSGQIAVRDKEQIPNFFERDEQGTDIFILGFEDSYDWEQHMIKSVLNFFWCSILNGIIEVNVGNTKISSGSLESLMGKYFSEAKPDKTDEPNPWPYYRAYTSADHRVYPASLPTQGEVKLFVLQNDEYPSKVAYIRRTGMVIQKKGPSSITRYAGVFICDDEDGNRILRKMENSKHDEWNKNNATESEFFGEAKKAEKELKDFIGNSIKDMTSNDDSKSSRIGGLEEYLYLKGDEGIGDSSQSTNGRPIEGISQHETPPEVGIKDDEELNIKPEIRKMEVIAPQITTGKPGIDNPIVDHGSKKKGKINRGSEGDGNKQVIILRNVKYRTFATKDTEGKTNHVLIIKGPPDIHFFAELKAGTDDSFDTVNIVRAEDSEGNSYQVDNNFIKGLNMGSSGEIKLKVLFDTREKYSLNLTAYENK